MQPITVNCDRIRNIRKYCMYSLLAVTPLGFGVKLYKGPAQWWFNNYGAGLLYEIFWVLVVFLIFPSKKLARKIPVWVFFITCALEILQLWNAWILQMIRSSFIGRASPKQCLSDQIN